MKLLLEWAAYVHADDDGALREAAMHGHTEIVKLLLERGANVHTYDDFALRLAAMHGHKETVKLLLEWGADVHDEALRKALKEWVAKK